MDSAHLPLMGRTAPLTSGSGVGVMPQYSVAQVLFIWALATLPMAALAWIVVPLWLPPLATAVEWARALLVAMTAGLIWQGVVVLWVVKRERGNLRWHTLREALWLGRPRHPRSGQCGLRVWWVCLPLMVLMGLETLLPGFSGPSERNLIHFLQSTEGHAFFRGNWSWFGLTVVLALFNTVLGEELLFRGLLLPRMTGAFGRADWVANGVLFAVYHLHQPWDIPSALLDVLALAGPSKFYRSAWIGIVVHSSQSVLMLGLILSLVLS